MKFLSVVKKARSKKEASQKAVWITSETRCQGAGLILTIKVFIWLEI